jgi:alpha/beta superfamily hydrolase
MPSPAPDDALTVESIGFSTGPHRLEGELAYSGALHPLGAVALAGPHPLLGGTMDNNVVRALAAGLAQRNMATLRFNYRGVGRSEGPPGDAASDLARFWQTSRTPEEKNYRADLTAAVAHLREAVGPRLPLALVGYSFGCTLLPHAGLGGDTPLVLIAPTVGTHDYDGFAGATGPLLVIAPRGDFAADAGRLSRWFDGLGAPRRLVRANLDNHFFRGHEPWLVDAVQAFLRDQWG